MRKWTKCASVGHPDVGRCQAAGPPSPVTHSQTSAEAPDMDGRRPGGKLHAVTCPSCGLALPPVARFCARCGTRLAAEAVPVAPAAMAPVWLLALLWVGSAGLLSAAAFYGALAVGLIQPTQIDPTVDPAQVRPTSAVIALCAGSLCAAHGAAAVGLMGRRPWARTFATLVCVVWALTCIGLPVGLLGISALWRPRRPARGVGSAEAIR